MTITCRRVSHWEPQAVNQCEQALQTGCRLTPSHLARLPRLLHSRPDDCRFQSPGPKVTFSIISVNSGPEVNILHFRAAEVMTADGGEQNILLLTLE